MCNELNENVIIFGQTLFPKKIINKSNRLEGSQ